MATPCQVCEKRYNSNGNNSCHFRQYVGLRLGKHPHHITWRIAHRKLTLYLVMPRPASNSSQMGSSWTCTVHLPLEVSVRSSRTVEKAPKPFDAIYLTAAPNKVKSSTQPSPPSAATRTSAQECNCKVPEVLSAICLCPPRQRQ